MMARLPLYRAPWRLDRTSRYLCIRILARSEAIQGKATLCAWFDFYRACAYTCARIHVYICNQLVARSLVIEAEISTRVELVARYFYYDAMCAITCLGFRAQIARSRRRTNV